MIFAFFDFESTDADPKTARITELAVALYTKEGKMTYAYSSTLHDQTYPPITEVASKLTGITDEHLKKHGALPCPELAILLNNLRRADFIVGHNVRRFDIPLLTEELGRYDCDPVPARPVIDTRYDLPIPDHIDTRKLPYLALEHGIVAQNAHAALADVMTTASLFFKYDLETILKRAESPNIWVQAKVTYDTRELAKERKFMWDGNMKIWVKEIKELDYEKEVEQAEKFEIIKLQKYTPQVK